MNLTLGCSMVADGDDTYDIVKTKIRYDIVNSIERLLRVTLR